MEINPRLFQQAGPLLRQDRNGASRRGVVRGRSSLYPSRHRRSATVSTAPFCDGERIDIGYTRTSTGQQPLELQLDALTTAGCHRVFTKTASGAKADRPVLQDVLGSLRPDDTLFVWRLDRLGRSFRHLDDGHTWSK